MNKIYLAFRYLNYFIKSGDAHSLQSPFAYDFYTKIIKATIDNPEFYKIEILRQNLKKDKTQILITDLGAGSGINKENSRSIASICANSQKKSSLAKLIYRIILNQKPSVSIDLGTSLGLTTLYESIAYKEGKIYTFEGCANTSALAKENFKTIGVQNIELVVGNIDSTLPSCLKNIKEVNFAFFDANHRYEPTLRYFNLCLEKANEDSIFIFDDIYWSEEMMAAWAEIKKHPSVTMTMDLFYLGIVFFRKKQPVQHFTLR